MRMSNISTLRAMPALWIILSFAGRMEATPDPSAVYCTELGYSFEIRPDGNGGTYGVCVFPDGSFCSSWAYFTECYLAEPSGQCHWPCQELPCKEAGQTIYVGECCEGLKQIPAALTYDEDCNPIGIGGAGPICSDCGNGVCEPWESKCNCPLDCREPRLIYVDDDAAGANDGSKWENAYNFLQDALTDANSSEKPVEIRIAQGVYTPDSNSAVAGGTRDRWATFHLINGVSLKGGYAGFGESNPDSRDFELYETIMSGDLNCDDGPDFSNNGENSMHVVTGSGTNETAVFDGFTVVAGRGHGGGMCNYFASPIVNNCTFSGNSVGGMYNNNSSPTLTNCTFSGNKATFGAGIWNCANSSPTLTNCTFTGNSASVAGGGMHNMGDSGACRPTLRNCTFSGNSAKELGGGMYSRYSRPTLTNCMFRANSADFLGGGMYNNHSSPMVTDCTFCGNSAGDMGGGIYNGYFSSPVLSRCTLSGNSADGTIGGGGMINGGGMYGPSNPILTNCAFTGNFTNGNGGAILNVRIGATASNLTLTNCTFAANLGANGNAVACVALDALYPAKIEIVNCILWDGGDEIWSDDGSAITVTHSDVQGGQAGVYDPREGLIWGAGNIDVDPLFVDPGYWDPNGTPEDPNDDYWVDGDYHLKSQAGRYDSHSATWIKDDVTSPCIDAGDQTSPIGHEPFPNGGIINMGANGGTADASKSYLGKPPCQTIVAGDINGDCVVDFKDFQLMAFHWLESG